MQITKRLAYKLCLAALLLIPASLFAGDFGPIIYASKKPTTKNPADYAWMQNHGDLCKPYEAPKNMQACTMHNLLQLDKTKVPDAILQLCREGDDYEIDPWLLFKTKAACQKMAKVVGTNYHGRREYKVDNGWKPIIFK